MAQRSKGPGWISRWFSVVIANRGRSCRPQPCSIRRRILMTPTSMRPWREISAAAGLMCGSGRLSRKPHPDGNRRGKGMVVAQRNSGRLSRRSLLSLSAGLAGGFMFSFHLPVRAFNEPVQPPDETARQVGAQRLYSHRSVWEDRPGDTSGRNGAGSVHIATDDHRRRT